MPHAAVSFVRPSLVEVTRSRLRTVSFDRDSEVVKTKLKRSDESKGLFVEVAFGRDRIAATVPVWGSPEIGVSFFSQTIPPSIRFMPMHRYMATVMVLSGLTINRPRRLLSPASVQTFYYPAFPAGRGVSQGLIRSTYSNDWFDT